MNSKKKKVPAVWVVFDTNAIHTGAAHYLLRKEVSDFIAENSSHPDLKIRWILPEVVRQERQYQMNKSGIALLPSIEKLERLLGHNLNITADIIDSRIASAISSQLTDKKVEVATLDTQTVDWRRLIDDSVSRKAPFDAGSTEKGFRDAVILETFAQLHAAAPVEPKNCRLVLVSTDERLIEAAQMRFAGQKNVRILSTVDELRGLVNTLVSTVDEAFVASMTPQAQKIFFHSEDTGSLYYANDIRSAVLKRIREDVGNLPKDADIIESGRITIHPPQFVRKEGQSVYWTSRLDVDVEAKRSFRLGLADALKSLEKSNEDKSAITFSWSPKPFSAPQVDWQNVTISGSSPTGKSQDAYADLWRPQLTSQGKAGYEIAWHVVVSTAQKLTRPKIDALNFLQVSWE